MFNREKWLEEDCVYTYKRGCAMCPYAVYGKDGICKCEKEMYEECVGKKNET